MSARTAVRPSWFADLRCVACHGALSDEGSRLSCAACAVDYPVIDADRPVLMTPEDRERFGLVSGSEPAARMGREYDFRQREDLGARAWRAFAPPLPVYMNPDAPPMTSAGGSLNLWLGGGGLDTGNYLNIDIAAFHGVNVVATAARLPFATGSCDRITCPALLEHVPDARAVVTESYRLLKSGGTIHAVVPFCHPYHAYPADYSRFSRDGLMELFSDFSDTEVGIWAGPATTILTFLTYWGKLVFPVHHPNRARRWMARGVMGAWGWITAPLARLDRWLNRLPDAHVLANHLWVTGKKP